MRRSAHEEENPYRKSDSSRTSGPPRFATWLLVHLFRRRRDRVVHGLDEHRRFDESVAGDLEEVYFSMLEEDGRRLATRWYWGETLRAVLPSVNYKISLYLAMLTNNIKIAFRHLWRSRGYTAINVAGLGIAMAAAVLVFLFVGLERSFDRFHPDSDRLYRVGQQVFFEHLDVWENTPFPLAAAARSDVPGIEEAARLTVLRGKGARAGDVAVMGDIHMVSAAFLDMFRFPLRLGTPDLGPRSVILSSDLATRLLGVNPQIGSEVRLELSNGEWTPFTLSGVATPIPANSSIVFDILISDGHYTDVFGEVSETEWQPKSATVTFLKLTPGADPAAVETSLDQLGRSRNLEMFLEGHEVESVLPIEPLTAAHYSPMISNRILRANGDPGSLSILVAIALALVVIACANFVNLSLGLSARRVREVGVRKVFGADRRQIVRQYLVESEVVALAGLALGLLLACGFMPFFNEITERSIEAGMILKPTVLLSLLGVGLLVGAAAGSYPTLVLSRFRPIEVFRSRFRLGGKFGFGRVMVGFQFSASIFLIIASLVATRQLKHLQSIDLGYNADLVVLQNVGRNLPEAKLDLYRELSAEDPDILGVSGARATMLGDNLDSALLVELDRKPYPLAANKIDYDFLDVMELHLLDGRNLARNFATDAAGAALVNEAFVQTFGTGVGDDTPFAVRREGSVKIVGVVKDFNFVSLRHTIAPVLMYTRPESDYRQVLTRVSGHDLPKTLARMKDRWDEIQSGVPFSYRFLDEAVANQYLSEYRNRRLGTIGAVVSLAIALAGLLGLTALSVADRTQEIGIRKVLGASGHGIVALFLRGHATTIGISILVAVPASYFAMGRWLDQFAYRIDVSPTVAAAAVLVVVGAAATTVIGMTLRAAVRNPVDAIRVN